MYRTRWKSQVTWLLQFYFTCLIICTNQLSDMKTELLDRVQISVLFFIFLYLLGLDTFTEDSIMLFPSFSPITRYLNLSGWWKCIYLGRQNTDQGGRSLDIIIQRVNEIITVRQQWLTKDSEWAFRWTTLP